MDLLAWKACVVASNKFEMQLLVDLLRNAGVKQIVPLSDMSFAFEGFRNSRANLLFLALASEIDAIAFVRQLRRAKDHSHRRAPVMVISDVLTAAQAERFRQAGANAIIGKPVSTAALVNVTKKVLARPRPFVEGINYVGPCRRAGIVMAGPADRRRRSDAA